MRSRQRDERSGAKGTRPSTAMKRASEFVSLMAWVTAVGACNAISGTSDFSLTGTKDTLNPDPSGSGPGGETGAPPTGTNASPDTPASSNTDAVSVVAPTGLDFGDNPCGNTPAPRAVEVHNLGTTEITFEAALADGSFFSVSPTNGTVPGGGVSLLTVSTPGVPSNGPVGPRPDTLTVTTNAAGETPHPLAVKLSANGAIFKVSPESLNYGQMTNQPITKTVTISNEGNLAGAIGFSLTENVVGSYSIKTASPLTIEPGGSAVVSITAAPPKSGPTEKGGRVGFSSSASLCGPLPAGVGLTCRRPD